MGNFDTRVSDDCILLFNVISSGPFLPHPLNQFLFVKVLEVLASHIVLLLILFVEGEQFLASSKVIFFRFLNSGGGLLLIFHAFGKPVHLCFVLVLDHLLPFVNFLDRTLSKGEFFFVSLLLVFLKFRDGLSLLFKLLDVLDEWGDFELLFCLLCPKLVNLF